MKTLILSAGQGRRLLPFTEDRPKCLLPIRGKTVIEWQMQELAECGIADVTVVVGFGADKVREALASSWLPLRVRTVYNPLFEVSDNLVSCWMAREAMRGDFILLNGDTLFEQEVVDRLLASESSPVTIAISRKRFYDSDDMKVRCDGTTLLGVSKDLHPHETDGESIGMLLFRGEGPRLYRQALNEAVAKSGANRRW